MDDPQPEVCQICGEGPVERVLYPVAVHYKGSGFYSTDYGRGGRKKEAPSKDGASSGDGDGGEKKKEKKEKKEATEA
jgi:predicted nucleic acid-binding Zn ribbon protein